jgi:hypothetical protein
VLSRDPLQLALVIPDALCQRVNRLQDGPKGRPECLRDVLDDLVVETARRALGQPSPEGFNRSPDVVNKLCADIDQRLA